MFILPCLQLPNGATRNALACHLTEVSNRSLSRVLLLASIVLFSLEASAYCRQNSCAEGTRLVCDSFEDPDDCHEVEEACERDAAGCIAEGHTLHRSTTCLSFGVAKGNAQTLGLNDQKFLDVVTRAFEVWTSVDCGGGRPPGFQVQSVGLVTASGAFYCSEANLNLSTWFLSRNWRHDPEALGYATTISDRTNGLVYDSDVELNVLEIATNFPAAEREAALLAIAVHEAGHFLGLAHSQDGRAVMYEAYSRSGLSNRPLTQDDIDGICAIFPPTDTPPTCAAPGVANAALDARACQSVMEAEVGVGATPPAAGESDAAPPEATCSVRGSFGAPDVVRRLHGVGLWALGLMAWVYVRARRRK